jgi:hypothetical protein
VHHHMPRDASLSQSRAWLPISLMWLHIRYVQRLSLALPSQYGREEIKLTILKKGI